MIIDNDNTIWIDGVPYIRDDSKIPPQITLHPDYHPTIRFRIKRWYWGLQCKDGRLIPVRVYIADMKNVWLVSEMGSMTTYDDIKKAGGKFFEKFSKTP